MHEIDADIVFESGWLSVVPEELHGRINDACTARTISKGTILWHFGDNADGLYLVVSGCIRVETSDVERGSSLLTIFHRGSWIGEIELLSGTRRITTMSALRDCSLLFLPRSDLMELSRQYPEIWRGLGYLASEHLYLAVAGMSDLMMRSGSDRLAAILLRICGARVPGFSGVITPDLDVTQAELAQLCNLSRSVISEHLEEFERCGIVETGYGRLKIVDVAALADKVGLTLQNTVD